MPPSRLLYRRVRDAGAVGMSVLVLLILAYLGLRAVAALSAVVIPVTVALLLAALLHPVATWLGERSVPRWLATPLIVLGGLTLLGGLLTFAVNSLVAGLGDLGSALQDSVEAFRAWLRDGPLDLSQQQLDDAMAGISDSLRGTTERLLTSATSTASALGGFLLGTALVIFSLVFFLYDGRRIWTATLTVLPGDVRDTADRRGVRAFRALSGYARAAVVIALVDAVGIGVGIAVIGIPLVVPLASLVFLGAFVPIIGAVVSGLVAVLVALVTDGPLAALLVAAVVIGVQQLEGQVLQPLLVGSAVRLHPLAVVLAVAVGATVAGVVGALLAVPVVLVLREFVTKEPPQLPAAAEDERPARAGGERGGDARQGGAPRGVP